MKELPNQFQPATIRINLIRASLFLAAYEILRSEIVHRVRSFFVDEFDEAGSSNVIEYETHVLSLDSHLLEASCKWLISMDVLTSNDVCEIQNLRGIRNRIAHDLPNLLLSPAHDVARIHLDRIRHLVTVVGKFWGSVAADLDPQFDNVRVDYDGIQSGSSIILNYIIEVTNEDSERGRTIDADSGGKNLEALNVKPMTAHNLLDMEVGRVTTVSPS